LANGVYFDMKTIRDVSLAKAILSGWLLLLLAGCAAPAAGVVQPEPTAAALPPTATPAPGAPLLLIGWDETLGRVVRAVDPLTGADAAGHPPLPFAGERDDSFITPTVLAPDGGRLAVFDVSGEFCHAYAGGSACGARSSAVNLVDIAAWSLRPVPLAREGWVGPAAFSADGRRLAVSVQSGAIAHTLLLIDAVAGTTLTEAELPFAPSRLGFGPDDMLVVYGQAAGDVAGMSPPPAPRVLLLDGATLAPVWETTLDELSSGHWCAADCDAGHGFQKMISHVPGVALSPDGARLYIVHADDDRLTTVDLARRSVRTVDMAAEMAWFERLLALTAGVAHAKGPMDSLSRHVALSPDGVRLYAGGYDMLMGEDGAGEWSVTETMQPLRIIDTATGRILAESDTPSHALQLTADGRYLLALDLSGYVPDTTVLDAETLAVVTRVEGHHVVTATSTDGATRFVAQSIRHHRTGFTLFDPQIFAPVAEWSADGPAWLAAE